VSSVIGHSLVGAICARLHRGLDEAAHPRWLIAATVLLSVLPDVDVVLYILFRPEGMAPHRGFTHSITFVAAAALIGGIATAKFFATSRGKLFAVFFAAGISHLVLDAAMGLGAPIAFFWPLSSHAFLAPISLVPAAYYSTSTRGLLALLTHRLTLIGVVCELAIFVPVLRAVSRGAKLDSARRGALVGLALLAWAATLVLYN
jgi:membrane-bound metal-dependent hydrolase YbcI (DUF457 family)